EKGCRKGGGDTHRVGVFERRLGRKARGGGVGSGGGLKGKKAARGWCSGFAVGGGDATGVSAGTMTETAMITHDLTRRDFFRGMTAAGLATITGTAPRLDAAEPVKHPEPTADTCILLWMAGGMAAPDTFD